MWRGSPPFARPLPLAKGDTGVVPRAIRRVAWPPPPLLVGAQGRRANECTAPSTLRPAPACTQGQRVNGGAWKGQGTPPSWRTSQLGGGGGRNPESPPLFACRGDMRTAGGAGTEAPPSPLLTRSRVRVGSGVRTPFAPAFAQNREGWGGAQTKRVCRPPARFVRRPVAQPFLPKRLRADGALGGGRWGVTRKWDETPEVGWGALVYTQGARKRRAAWEWERARHPSPFARTPVRSVKTGGWFYDHPDRSSGVGVGGSLYNLYRRAKSESVRLYGIYRPRDTSLHAGKGPGCRASFVWLLPALQRLHVVCQREEVKHRTELWKASASGETNQNREWDNGTSDKLMTGYNLQSETHLKHQNRNVYMVWHVIVTGGAHAEWGVRTLFAGGVCLST
ncbi:hypothetical protein EDB86DRAFT_2823962 [Lactarius hatsudake]|nr:hypothetical protein EDB86DRAFT_2823962 [Lactarius hatsudake]